MLLINFLYSLGGKQEALSREPVLHQTETDQTLVETQTFTHFKTSFKNLMSRFLYVFSQVLVCTDLKLTKTAENKSKKYRKPQPSAIMSRV